ncbi:MAG: radical SAM protein [Nannocystaceae bacterium]|nr:radical SAM protein [Nannocystaceae bacterium]
MQPAEDTATIAVPAAFAGLRRFALDGALMLFDRESGLCVRCEDASTRALRQCAPQVVQFAITNHCNLRCSFCSRDLATASTWTEDSAFVLLSQLAAAGLLEVAFGGGEPLTFAGFDRLLLRLYDETPLSVSLTTNGLLLDRTRLRAWHHADGRPRYGQIRVSIYDDVPWRPTLARLCEQQARFGANVLVTPALLPELETRVLELAALGCTDVLLLAYNGFDAALHVAGELARALAQRVHALADVLRGRVTIKLDVCWGSRMAAVPRLRPPADCGAGREFVVVTADRRLAPCSFHEDAVAFADATELLALWRARAAAMAVATSRPGCARRDDFGLAGLDVSVTALRRRCDEVNP